MTAHFVADDVLSFDERLALVKNTKHELPHHNLYHCTLALQKDMEQLPT